MKKLIIFLVGIPASGKSTFCDQYKDIQNAKIVSRDDIRSAFNWQISEGNVTHEFNMKLRHYVTDDTTNVIIIDNTNVRQKYITEIMNFCNRYNDNCKYFMKIFNVDYEICIERNSKRTGHRFVPANVMDRMYTNFKLFMKDVNKFAKDNNIQFLTDVNNDGY